MKIYINGKLVPEKDAKISVFDHGLLYGDGVFEGIRAYSGLVFRLEEHIDRLFASARAIMLEMPLDKQKFVKAVITTLKANRLKDAYIRLIVTRGTGDLGLDPRKCKRPTLIIIADKIALYPAKFYREGLEIITVPTQRNIPEALNPQIKSLNYLNNILAKIEACNSGAQEAVMLNAQGFVTECTGDNIFIVRKGRLLTPPPYVGTLKGITRDVVMELAKEMGFDAGEDILTRYDLFNADEFFLTGTAAEIIPVVKIDNRIIGEGTPGKITLQLMKAFKRFTKVDGVKY